MPDNQICKILFLLGGKDLEMETIRELLSDNGYFFADKELSWNDALLSKYGKELAESGKWKQIYGVELVEDVSHLPENYIRVDHHNQNASGPSALEQIAKIIGIQLNRRQILIAANDKGYIPAMIRAGATPEEIANIRREDRRAQGVSEKDEILAQKAIRENYIVRQSVTIIKALGDKFSPIADRLYSCDKLLIYTDSELTYYGKGIDILTQKFRQEIFLHKMYNGGGKSGYFGVAKSAGYLPEEIEYYKNEIITLVT